MKARYRLFLRRKRFYYAFDNTTRKYQSLNTQDCDEATGLLHALNEAARQPAMNLRLARVYLQHSDPAYSTRTWQHVMDESAKTKKPITAHRWRNAMQQPVFNRLRKLVIIETRAEHFLATLQAGTVSTNAFLRQLHNFALDMNWLPVPIVPRKLWPKVQYQGKRGITREEHDKILGGERNPEWRAYYQMLWLTGGAQTDVAVLSADNIDWNTKVIGFNRKKTGSLVQLHIGPELEQLLNDLPGEGLLFPNLAQMRDSDRASIFSRRCRLTGVSGVSLHCYRYAWAERARTVGYPERFAQEALGHSSKAVHRAYARAALVKLPSLEDYEKRAAETQPAAASATSSAPRRK